MNQAIYNKSRKDKFLFIMTLPPALQNIKSTIKSNSSVNLDKLQFSVYGTIVPNIIVPSVGVKYAGQELKISSHSRSPYENIFVDFDIDNEYVNYWVIYKWLDLLNDEKFSYYNKDQIADKKAQEALQDYSTIFTVYGIDEYNNNKIKFDYTGCFPVSLGGFKLNDRDPNIIQSQFEFSFTRFESELV